MIILRAFRDAGRVSAGSPPSHLQAERWLKRRCAFHPGFLLSFSFPFRAFRSAPGGKVRSLGAPREPSRAGGLGRGRRGGRLRWRRKNREPVAVVGRGRRGAAGVSGRRAFPRRQRQFRSGRAKKQATKRRTKKDFPSPKRRRFVKTGFSARYKEANRFRRRRGRPRGRKSPGPGKGDRRCRLSHFAVKKSGRPSRLLDGPKGGSNLWKPLAGDRRAVLRESPTNPGPGVSNPNYACFAIERVMDRNDKSKENA